MGYTMGKNLTDLSVDMNIVQKLCKINEYKGQQIIYKKQPKSAVSSMTDNAIIRFVYDTYSENFSDGNENLMKLINNEITPKSRQDISVVEFRDVIKTVNSAYEDIKISSQTILELHGYLHRYSLVRGGRYRNEEFNFLSPSYINLDTNDKELRPSINIDKQIERDIESLCDNYYKLIEEESVQDLIVISSFIMDFILIYPFKEDNIKMVKILTLLLLNKSGYEIGRFTSLGKIYDYEDEVYLKKLFTKISDYNRQCQAINNWLDYVLSFILNAYEDFSEEMNLTETKRETKTRRIEKIINSTLGYFTKDDIRNQCPDIPEPTINRVFNNLRKSGKIEVIAKGRSAKWKKK